MYGLYNCNCRVSYRPFASNKLVVFDENQVVSASISLNFDPNIVNLNAEGLNNLTEFSAALVGSTANVTLSDPYLTGAAWLALFDSAAAYSNTYAAAAEKIMLPTCGEGENPASGKCRPDPYKVIEDTNLGTNLLSDFAHILVTLYYKVAGTTFSLDTYFRLEGFQINHGKTYPSVSLRGVEPQNVIFNQSLENFKLEENKTLEENLTDIVSKYGYQASFCVPPDDRENKPYIMPRSFKERNITAAEVIKKYVNSVGGSILTMPTKDYARKVSLCTRANTNQGCSVFYLGKGLYEGYSIDGQIDRNLVNQNVEYDQVRGLGYNYDSAPLDEGKQYKLENLAKEARTEKLRNAQKDKIIFPPQFSKYEKRYSDKYSSSGYIWTASVGPEVTTERVQSTNMYGIGVNGTKPKAMLDGEVLQALPDSKRVVIATNYFLRYCTKDPDTTKCWNTAIFQESVNLETIKVKIRDKVGINEEIGTATQDNPEFIRFYIAGNGRAKEITISPGIVWNYAIPVEKLTDEEKKKTNIKSVQQTPSGPVTTPAVASSGQAIGRVGNTGYSTGPHLHAEFENKSPITARDLDGIITIGGKPPSAWKVSSAYGAQRGNRTHKGVDLTGPPGDINNQPVGLLNGRVVDSGFQGDGWGNFVVIDSPKGRIVLAHFADGTTSNVRGITASSASKYSSGVQSGPAPLGASVTTEFKGVPRALRIVPGRTVLSFITQYDEWVEKGRPADIDPGVWIAGRFKNWFIYGATYNWSQGDLRVSLRGITDWGNTTAKIQVPSFEDYLKAFQETGELSEYTKDYYGYIRSLGDLCWKLKDGKNSCETICEEAQQIQNYYIQPGEQNPSVGGNFPPSQCKNKDGLIGDRSDVANQVMGMLRSVGINTKVAYAGVLGNAWAESSMNPDVRSGSGCSSTPSRILGVSGYGIFQWCGSRADELAAKCGRNCSLQQQLEFTANEIRTGRNITAKCVNENWISKINSAKSPQEAADIWNTCYERGPGGIPKRQSSASRIFNELDCNAVNP